MSSTLRSDDQIIGVLQDASQYMKVADFSAAVVCFESILSEISNPNVDKFRAAILGMLGESYFSLGNTLYGFTKIILLMMTYSTFLLVRYYFENIYLFKFN